MAISEFSAGPRRRRIGFVRYPPPTEAQRAFDERGYECYLLDDVALKQTGSTATTDSVIISQQLGKPSHFIADLKRFSDVLNYDCRLYVRYQTDLDSKALVLDCLSREKLPPSGFDKADGKCFSSDWFDPVMPIFAPFVHILRADTEWPRLANLIASNPAGPPPNPDLAISPSTAVVVRSGSASENELSNLTEERALLLKRAFWDCSSIELFRKTDGMSGVDAFEAFAHRANSSLGDPAPYRCFVKLGPRAQVAREFEKYRTTALENVPFHLGPRLRADRCVLGKLQGLITCDYVMGAETLRDCVRDGRGVHVIGNLFNQTLISWRRAAEVQQRLLWDFLEKHLRERSIIPEHRQPLVKAYGGERTLGELKVFMSQACASQPILIGMIHGDLHATNVLVRMNDAVIIDLERISADQPLLLDAASLEGGLFVDGFVGDPRSAKKVLDSITPLYTATALEQDDHYCNAADRSAWFVDSVRQIRMQARQMERQRHQYGWTLAAVLLKKACNPDKLPENMGGTASTYAMLTREHVRAMAFVVAEKIILELSAQGGISAP